MEKMIFCAVILGVLLIGCTFSMISHFLKVNYEKERKNCTVKTPAKILEMRRITNQDSSSVPTTSWFPVYEYYVSGTRLEKQSNFGQDKQIFYEGQTVELFYNPNNWNEYYVPEENREKIFQIFQVLGIVFICCSVIGIFVYGIIFL